MYTIKCVYTCELYWTIANFSLFNANVPFPLQLLLLVSPFLSFTQFTRFFDYVCVVGATLYAYFICTISIITMDLLLFKL